ncbi:MAG: hypothetical protein QY330_00605 [Candidatus Dojkabacteria bacterium]|uniref:Uncharacterized protein n=1 Tax=Candidatus Dojkabacteria bacterium TaxID=2099670 RepID=A0A952DVQ2_9BACT|nr:hypothetical protein [Candidatus Dojkabacteria bacterium]WKZ28095.1 MAG: hypothetical protein QY330_00605 [Candidatus Dojkabacteria bacterium]
MQRKKGLIALSTLIIVTAILLVGGITLLITSADLAKATRSYNQILYTGLRSRSCLEEALYRLRIDPFFTGSVILPFPDSYPDGNCSASISNLSGNLRQISVTSVFEDVTITKTSTVDISTNPPTLVD